MKLVLFLLSLALAFAAPAAADEREPDIVLAGEITHADHQTYRDLVFDVPEGMSRVTVAFSYSGREERTTIDLGLRDPAGFRGWSGGNKSRFTVAEFFATPSYRPGPILPGEWAVVIGVPNIREDVTARYEARIWLDGPDAAPASLGGPAAAPAPGWRRGDLHTHTGHSDASCANRSGMHVPCPVHVAIEAAIGAGLDFVAITDHNTATHLNALRELAPYYDDIVIIPGAEVTTFHGHANVLGATEWIDFQLSSEAAAFTALLDQAERTGAIVSVNHPRLPSGEDCMGCGWTGEVDDWSRVAAIEVVNGATIRRAGTVEHPFSGIPFWEDLLNDGHRITAIGGSDNHDPAARSGPQAPVGSPATVVWSLEASPSGVLDGIRQGRVFIDIANDPDRLLDMKATFGEREAVMGAALVSGGAPVEITAEIAGVSAGRAEFIGPEGAVAESSLSEAEVSDDRRVVRLTLSAQTMPAWLRVQVRDAEGAIVLLGNPIYFE